LLHERAKLADFIISTAQVPGKPAPRLITKEMVADMKPGSVIVDLAAESGGNCELTQADQIVRRNGVTILGPTNLPATLPLDASRMFGAIWPLFILEITNENGFTMDWKNEIFAQTCITLNGERTETEGRMSIGTLAMIYIFILAIFTGVEVISRVPTVLHTPLMSGANAIHGIVLIGGVILLGLAGDNTFCLRAGLHRRDSRHAQRRRRIRRHRPDAGNVQSQTAPKTSRTNDPRHRSRSRLPDRLVAVHLWLEAPQFAAHGAFGQHAGRHRHGAGAGRHFSLPGMGHFGWILLAIVIGTVPGWLLAKRVKMTAMPQMVSLFNGMGGACALFISLGEWLREGEPGVATWADFPAQAFPMLLGIVFGSVSFTGSLVAFGKLQGLITEKPLRWPLQKTINDLLLILGHPRASARRRPSNTCLVDSASGSGALLLGVLQVLPIGGADMPVVISVLNSCTGLAAAVTGFAMHNMSMIIAGTLVGAAGSLLDSAHVQGHEPLAGQGDFRLVRGWRQRARPPPRKAIKTMREIAASECAIMMGYARKVIIIPGYGLAVAQGQHLVHELDDCWKSAASKSNTPFIPSPAACPAT
jgi:hypothetical protein